MDLPASVHHSLSSPIRSLSLDKEELRAFLEWVEERSLAAAQIEIGYLKPTEDPASLERDKETVRTGARLWLTVKGKNGKELIGSIPNVFDSPNFPESVESVYFDTENPLRIRHNYYIHNKCSVTLDFTRPGVFNFSLMPSSATQNDSFFVVRGQDATWVNGLYNELTGFLKEHPATLPWLHRHTIYDFLVWFIGLPVGLWACYRASGFVTLLFSDAFLRAGTFLYLSLLTLVMLRVLFHYARWIWPLVEYRHARDRALKHKAAWVTLVGGVAANIAYDVIKAFR